LGNFLRNQADDRIVDVKELEVYGRNSILAGKDCGDSVVGQEAELHEIVAQAAAVLALVVERLPEMLRAN